MSKRVTQLTELTTPAIDDYLPIVDTSTGITKKITYRNLVNIPELGWTSAGETWVYASATTFTVAGVDVTEKYPVGTKIRWKQGGSYKYAYVVTRAFSTNTTITIAAGSDYSIANSTITDNYFSYASVATGFPGAFNYNPAWSNFTIGTGGSASTVAHFMMNGKTVSGWVKSVLGTSGQSVGSNPGFTAPVTASSSYNAASQTIPIGENRMVAGGGGFNGRFLLTSTTVIQPVYNDANVGGLSSTSPGTWAAGNYISGSFSYEAA